MTYDTDAFRFGRPLSTRLCRYRQVLYRDPIVQVSCLVDTARQRLVCQHCKLTQHSSRSPGATRLTRATQLVEAYQILRADTECAYTHLVTRHSLLAFIPHTPQAARTSASASTFTSAAVAAAFRSRSYLHYDCAPSLPDPVADSATQPSPRPARRPATEVCM
jgi:hypothetical protein